MTIKRTWIDTKGRPHERELKPGYTERIRTVFNDAECKGYHSFGKGIIRVISNDVLRYKEKDTLLARVLGLSDKESQGVITIYQKAMIQISHPKSGFKLQEFVGEFSVV